MIIDCNANIGRWPFRRLNYSDPAGLLGRLARCGIRQAWAGAFEAVLARDCHMENGPLAEAVSGHEALVPLATINPEFPRWEQDLCACVRSYGFRGIRVYPNYHLYTLDDPRFEALLTAAEELGVFVALAVRMTDERHHFPRCMIPPVDLEPLPALAGKHPQLRILVVNGNNGDVGRIASAIEGLPNLYFEMSRFESVCGVETVARRIGVHRVLFGTHAPYYYPESALLKITRECSFTAAEQEAILGGNAEQFLAG